jgi:hypothetical protein
MVVIVLLGGGGTGNGEARGSGGEDRGGRRARGTVPAVSMLHGEPPWSG